MKIYEWAEWGMPEMPRYKNINGANHRLARFYATENSWGKSMPVFQTYLYLPEETDLAKALGASCELLIKQLAKEEG